MSKIREEKARCVVAKALNITDFAGTDNDFDTLEYEGLKITVRASLEPTHDEPEIMFDIRNPGDSDLHIFAHYSDDWQFWTLLTTNVKSTYDGQTYAPLNLIRPISMQSDIAGLKASVNLNDKIKKG